MVVGRVCPVPIGWAGGRREDQLGERFSAAWWGRFSESA